MADYRTIMMSMADATNAVVKIRALLLANPTFDDPHTADAARVADIAKMVGLIVHTGLAGEPMQIAEGP